MELLGEFDPCHTILPPDYHAFDGVRLCQAEQYLVILVKFRNASVDHASVDTNVRNKETERLPVNKGFNLHVDVMPFELSVLICPLLSGPISILELASQEEWNGEETQAGGDYRQAA